ncbi:unnamed protein product [Didymodactylos carnosus]|uniref:Homeobox domain-containing protein n=1 Tax=Didymodactylos carnosus TaxID=1234261 RepID=A0A814LZ60_9BILA|nr:unnamed protein product [Didymodactylos carnosus]CAF1071651.1 unnamed protein product [Didymodactylos carnosus]CAF3547619.1 unnamed protein product [Didymodactylos carnosus]CAF3838685.1 unnamed protein product [Didymodactylos carnosus]
MSDYQHFAYDYNDLNLSSFITPKGQNKLTDSGFISRTPTPPTPSIQQDDNGKESDSTCLSNKSDISQSKSFTFRKRSRIQYTAQQLQTLETAFKRTHYPEVTIVDQLAELLNVQHEKISVLFKNNLVAHLSNYHFVQIWFQNRRSRFKRQQKCKTTRKNEIKPLEHIPTYENIENYPPPPIDPVASGYYYHYPYYHSSWSTPMHPLHSSLQWTPITSTNLNADSMTTAFSSTPSTSSNFSNPPWQDYSRPIPLTDIQQ